MKFDEATKAAQPRELPHKLYLLNIFQAWE